MGDLEAVPYASVTTSYIRDFASPIEYAHGSTRVTKTYGHGEEAAPS